MLIFLILFIYYIYYIRQGTNFKVVDKAIFINIHTRDNIGSPNWSGEDTIRNSDEFAKFFLSEFKQKIVF